MPEGPEIRRVADQLEVAVVGQPLTDVWFAFPELKTYEPALLGEQVASMETRGKALLTHFSNGLTLYSHNQLYGVWRIVPPDMQPETKRQLRVRLATANQAILLYSASDIELLNAETLARHPFLNRIGPDVLNAELTVDAVRERLCSPRFCRRRFSGLLLDQAFLAGLGNYLRAEILWLAQLLPRHNAQSLSEAQLTAFCEALLSVPRHAYRMRGTMKKYHSEAAFRFEVFHRQGKTCRRCGEVIEKGVLSARPFYWCPGCQR
ncbi:endonuclease VIII [Pantoea stewartii]|uniref:Endonuclease 8 n=1 Tax=Pantoea stewartii subsp. stewartii DC283 TaxID=660596 RepID=H3RAR9_PANSE|nr:endonuclease VIII [Pantoea stewartii]ARF49331.1 endonuclease VIII [Pantoea stewartii subsp. stewartii DC283]EHU01519.1 endonuclease VIII [Pantoea stewartii subsp. stewartii DC283]KAB0557417.1 endonuclease VIII [Pantoea stewartii subsp. stewartii]